MSRPFTERSFTLSEGLLAGTNHDAEGPPSVLQAGNLRLHFDIFSVMIDDRQTNLTQQEFRLLSLLLARPDRVISHEELCVALWGAAGRKESKRLAVVVSHLREKLYGAWPYAIESVRCRGYGLTKQHTVVLAKSGLGRHLCEQEHAPAFAPTRSEPPVDAQDTSST
jgi:DNA-binding response OmpR family regulator